MQYVKLPKKPDRRNATFIEVWDYAYKLEALIPNVDRRIGLPDRRMPISGLIGRRSTRSRGWNQRNNAGRRARIDHRRKSA